jgi:cellulose synthase/poly-beta-1,6-N-acetylglucosamine synthase-like glycosyltransferase
LEAVPYDAHSVVEDLEYHLRIVRSGRRIAFADRTTVYGEMPTSKRGFQTQRARWEGGRMRMIIENVPPLLREVIGGRLLLLEPLLDLMLLPLAFHTALLVCAVLIPVAAIRIYALAALMLVAVHVVAAIIVGDGDISDFIAILSAPLYVARKLVLLPHIFRSARPGATWVRTERE